jgi:hypothetical protein
MKWWEMIRNSVLVRPLPTKPPPVFDEAHYQVRAAMERGRFHTDRLRDISTLRLKETEETLGDFVNSMEKRQRA